MGMEVEKERAFSFISSLLSNKQLKKILKFLSLQSFQGYSKKREKS